MTLQKLFLTFFGTGLTPQSPKVVATFAALATGAIILQYLGMETLFMLAFAVVLIGIFEINKFENRGGEHHATSIVIDQAAGMWLSLMITSSTAVTLDFPYVNILTIVLSFAAFRLFDTWKPSTIGWLDREVKGGLGIMMGSVLSGIAGGLLSVVVLMGLKTLF